LSDQFSDEYGCDAPQVSAQEAAQLLQAPWPGNVRQLINVAERAVLQSRRGGGTIASLLMSDPEEMQPVMTTEGKPLKEYVEARSKIRGAATRILLDNEILKIEQAVGVLGYALSKSVAIADASSWLNGFLYGSGLLLIHNPVLWEIVDEWVTGLNDDQFQQMLPALRRTFAAFAASERQKMLQLVRNGQLTQRPTFDTTLDAERVKIILPMLQLFFDES